MTLILFIAPLNAHHITRFSYTWMQVGKALVNGYRVTLIVKPPERTLDLKGLKPKPAPAGVNKGLSGYTHHFQAFVEDVRLREPVPLLTVALSARTKGGSKEDFILQPRFGERGFHYGANIRLRQRGAYELAVILAPDRVTLSEHSKRRDEYFQTREARFEFEYGYQGLKELMGDLFGRFSALSGAVMGLGLAAPAKKPAIQALGVSAKKLDWLAGLIPNLRIGAAQARFIRLAKNLKGKTDVLATKLDRGNLVEAVEAVTEVRLACRACHRIFREGEFSGK